MKIVRLALGYDCDYILRGVELFISSAIRDTNADRTTPNENSQLFFLERLRMMFLLFSIISV